MERRSCSSRNRTGQRISPKWDHVDSHRWIHFASNSYPHWYRTRSSWFPCRTWHLLRAGRWCGTWYSGSSALLSSRWFHSRWCRILRMHTRTFDASFPCSWQCRPRGTQQNRQCLQREYRQSIVVSETEEVVPEWSVSNARKMWSVISCNLGFFFSFV